jgi:ATP-binding cassette subfamily B protein
MAPGHAFQQQARIGQHAGLHRRIQEKLFQHILLRMAAAQAMHHANGGAHYCHRAGMITAPMRQHGLTYWQRRIAHVPQAIYLSDASIAENIAFGVPRQQINLERVRQAAAQAQIAQSINGWQHGYDTFVGERGVRLSGGQRQRIGIARALYKQADVLVFDEATSALDNATEHAVMEAIEALGRDLTIIMVAHRITTLQRCDEIVELAAGQLLRMRDYADIA